MRGLDNLGNTCYMNSSLQALYATKLFKKYILKSECSKPLHSATRKLFQQMSGSNGKKSLEPNDFWKAFTKFKPEFQDRVQHDSQEFLSFLIIGIHEEVNEAKARRKQRPKDEPKDSKAAWYSFRMYEDDSKLVNIFVGQLSSGIRCTQCPYLSYSWEGFWGLSVPLPDESEQCTIDDCVRLLLAKEEMDSDSMILCPKCNQKRKIYKKIDLKQLPQVLIIHLKRFGNDGRKKHIKISIDDQICIEKNRYSVYSCVSHFGYSCSSGHYISHCKRNDKWYRFDDEDISTLDEHNLTEVTDPYIILYQRI